MTYKISINKNNLLSRMRLRSSEVQQVGVAVAASIAYKAYLSLVFSSGANSLVNTASK